MTVQRAPLSIDGALARIAGQLPGAYADMARVASRAESTVRNWGNPNTDDSVPLDCAIALDLAYQAAGGVGAPLYETYSFQLDAAHVDRFACAIELAHRTMTAIHEGGEAHEALVGVTLPGATDRDRRDARKEVEQAIVALQQCLAFLPAGPVEADADKPP